MSGLDKTIEGFEVGWPPFFEVLRLVQTRFAGQPCASFRLMQPAGMPEPEAWHALVQALGLENAAPGERRTGPGAPPFAGTVERGAGEGKNTHEVLLRLDEPAPGVALISAYTWGGQVHAALSFYLFGGRARAIAGRDEPLWQARVNELFAPAAMASQQPS